MMGGAGLPGRGSQCKHNEACSQVQDLLCLEQSLCLCVCVRGGGRGRGAGSRV